MNRDPRCADALNALDALALGALDDPEAHPVHTHLGVCGACADALAALGTLVVPLALAAPPEAVDARRCSGIRARLLARAAADAGQRRGA